MSAITKPLFDKPFGCWEDQSLCAYYRETGNQETLVVLIERYQNLLRAAYFSSRPPETSFEDFQQDIYLLLQRKLGYIVPQKFPSWLNQVAANQCHDKRRKRRPLLKENLPERGYEQEKRLDLGVDFTLVQHLLDQLTPEQQAYMQLVYLKGYKPREVQQQLAWPNGKTKIVYQNAMRQLRKYLQTSKAHFL